MTVAVTLDLPESVIVTAKRLSEVTQQTCEEVLADVLEMMVPILEDTPDSHLSPPVSTLTDAEVLHVAEAKMDATQNQRLGALQAKGKAAGLSVAERYELLALLQIYQLGHLRKSEALAEAVRRGLRAPLPA
jgi:hypothetical protein